MLSLQAIVLLSIAFLTTLLCVSKPFTLKKVTVLQDLDGDGNVVNEMEYSYDEMCWGGRNGAISEMCGGCCACIALQCEHYKSNYRIIDVYR